MADIHIQREHQLGFPRARELAVQWIAQAEAKLDMECTLVEGDGSVTVEFTRPGATGQLRVEADRFTLDAKLGFLMRRLRKVIKAEIESNLDVLMAEGSVPGATLNPAVRKAASKQSK